MSTILDLEAWLAQADLWDQREACALYEAVKNTQTVGIFECVAHQDAAAWFVKAPHTQDMLVLATPAHREVFLGMLRQRYDVVAAPVRKAPSNKLKAWRLPPHIAAASKDSSAPSFRPNA
jgi:hypothetical protein